jgi:hypothetical protein
VRLNLNTREDIRRLALYLRVLFYGRLLLGGLLIVLGWLLWAGVGSAPPYLIVVSPLLIVGMIHIGVLKRWAGTSMRDNVSGCFVLMGVGLFLASVFVFSVWTLPEILSLLAGPVSLVSYVLLLGEGDLCILTRGIAERIRASSIARTLAARRRRMLALPALLAQCATAAIVGVLLAWAFFFSVGWEADSPVASALRFVPYLSFAVIIPAFVWWASANNLTLKRLIGRLERTAANDLVGQEETP